MVMRKCIQQIQCSMSGARTPQGQAFNATFSASDVKQSRSFGQTLPISEHSALDECEKGVKIRVARPSTVELSRFVHANSRTLPNGRTVFETDFSVRNTYNLKLTFKVSCHFEGQRLTDVDISEDVQ